MLTTVILKKGRAKPFFYHHPWVFSGAVREIRGDEPDGGIVEVRSEEGDFIAKGYLNRRSQIVVRLLTWREDEAIDDAFWRARIEQAVALREQSLRMAETTNAYRLVNSEGDGLPGLVVDRYGDFLVVRFLALGVHARKERLLDLLTAASPAAGVYERSDGPFAETEGVAPHVGPARGEEPPDLVQIEENGVTFFVDVKRGQKTGAYLDQRENRLWFSRYTRGLRVLDCYTYNGGFGVYAAKLGGAASVTCVDASERAIALARKNAEANGLDNLEFLASRADDALRKFKAAGERFDAIALDPPKFVRSKHGLNKGRKAYRESNLLAMQLLSPEGLLLSCSCSQHMDEETFERTLNEAAVEAGKRLCVLGRAGQPADHAIAAACPESRYLKVYLCHVRDA